MLHQSSLQLDAFLLLVSVAARLLSPSAVRRPGALLRLFSSPCGVEVWCYNFDAMASTYGGRGRRCSLAVSPAHSSAVWHQQQVLATEEIGSKLAAAFDPHRCGENAGDDISPDQQNRTAAADLELRLPSPVIVTAAASAGDEWDEVRAGERSGSPVSCEGTVSGGWCCVARSCPDSPLQCASIAGLTGESAAHSEQFFEGEFPLARSFDEVMW